MKTPFELRDTDQLELVTNDGGPLQIVFFAERPARLDPALERRSNAAERELQASRPRDPVCRAMSDAYGDDPARQAAAAIGPNELRAYDRAKAAGRKNNGR